MQLYGYKTWFHMTEKQRLRPLEPRSFTVKGEVRTAFKIVGTVSPWKARAWSRGLIVSR